MSRNALEKWLSEPVTDINDWMLEGLRTGCELFNLETGIISQINKQDYIIQYTYSRLGEIFQPGDKFELENTYCEAVTRQNKTITYIQVGTIPEMRLHPVYVAVQLESYIGSPILDPQGQVIGTINFSSHEVRPSHFTTEEINDVEMMAKRISEVLATQ